MTRLARAWFVLGSLLGLGTVAMAAYAAHGVADPAARALVLTAVQMQGWHAIILVICGLWAARGGRLAHLAALAFAVGIVVFCGDVYLLALAGVHLGVAPLGGSLVMLGWLLLAASALIA